MAKRTRKSAKRAPAGVGAVIAARRRQRGWTLARLAADAGCARSYLWMIERGQRAAPGDEVLSRIETALGFERGELLAAARWEGMPEQVRQRVDELRGKERLAQRLAEILGGSGIRKDGKVAGALDAAHRSGELKKLVEELSGEEVEGLKVSRARVSGLRALRLSSSFPQGMGVVPLINSVAAGYPREFTDLGYPARVADDYVRVPGLDDPDAFACRVVGDSMLPEYREGDIVVFSPVKAIKSGQDCLARLEPDHETTFKRVYFEKEGKREMIRLQPLNPKYPARVFEREQVAGLFVAVSVTRVVG